MKNDYESLGKVLGPVVSIVAVNADTLKDVASNFGVKEFPTLLFFGQDKTNPVRFTGERKLQKIA